MAELQRNFLQGIMNKDLDPHFLPDGQYRDALNIIVGDSDGQFVSTEGSNNGAAQNYLGNTLMNSALGLTNAKCIGSFAYDAQSLIYWLVAADNADAIFEYNETLGLTTIVLKATKSSPTTPSILNFNKTFYVTGINYINGLLFWTDNYNPPRRINVERAKNYGVNGFTEDDISVILAPPLNAPTIALSNTGESNNLEDKFLYFAYRYKYLDDEYSALSPFSPVAFLPKQYEYDFGVSENISMVNSFNTVTLTYNRGGDNIKEVQLVYRDTRSLNAYVIDNIQTNTLSSSPTQTYQFKNNKVYSILDANQVNRLFDNVPLKAKSQELIGSRLIYGNYTQFFNLVDCVGEQIAPVFSLSLTDQSITGNNPKPTFKSNRDYEIGIVYLDDYGRSTTVIVPEGDNTTISNTIFIPGSKSNVANNIRVTIDKDFEPPCFATYYRFYIKQNRQDYYNLFPLTYFTEGDFRWFLINQADADKISVGSYVYLKNPTDLTFDIKYKILDIETKSAGFLNIPTQTQPAGVYFKIKINNAALPPIEQYYFNSRGASGVGIYQTIFDRFAVAEKAIFYGVGTNDLTTGNSNIYTMSSGLGSTLDARFYVEISDVTSSPNKYNWYIWRNGQPKTLVASNVPIVAGSDVALTFTYPSPSYSLSCSIRFASATGHTKNDYWVINCRCHSGYNIFGGFNYSFGGDSPSVLITGIGWNPTPTYNADRPITIGDTLSFNLVEPDTSFNQTLTFISNGDYVNIEEWFIEDNAYLKWTQNDGGGDRGAGAVSFRRAHNISEFTTGIYQASQGLTISTTTLNYPVLMYNLGFRQDSSSIIYSNFTYTSVVGGGSLLFETAPDNLDQDIYYELTGTYPITNGAHTGNVQNQILPNPGVAPPVVGQPAIVDLNTFTQNSNFNAFAWGNRVESYRIRDDFNAATMEFSPRANSTIEGYQEQTLVQALTYSGVYQQTTAINRLNEFNLSLGNFKYLDLFFGSIEKLYSRDTDLVVLQENKVSKVLYGKNLLSDSVGGGTIASIPEVLGTQIAYLGEYGISNNPESFAIWGNNLFFTDTRRGAVLMLSESGLSEISSQGMKNWFKTNLDVNTQKLGIFDPYFEHYVLSNNDNEVQYCLFEVNKTSINFTQGSSSQTIIITSNNEWYIQVPDNNWLTISPKYGNNKQIITITASANMGSLRSLVLTILGCSGTKTVTVSQAAHTTTTTTTTIAPTTTTTLPPTTTTTIPGTYYKLDSCDILYGTLYTTIVPNIANQRYIDSVTLVYYVWDNTTTTTPGTIGSNLQKVTGQSGCPGEPTTTTTTTTAAPMNLEVRLCGSSTTYYITVNTQGLTNGLAIKLNNGGIPFDGTQCWEIIDNATTQPIDYFNVAVNSISLNCASCSSTTTTSTTTCAPTTYYELSECAPGVGYAFTTIVPDLGTGQRYVLPSSGTIYTYTGSSISQCDVPPGYNSSIQKTAFTGCDSPTTTTTTVGPMSLEVRLCDSSTTYYITVSNQGLTNGLAIKLNNGGVPFDGTQCWEIIDNATTQPIDYFNVTVSSISLNCASCVPPTTTTTTTTTTTCAPTTYYELSECAPGVGYAFTTIVPDLGTGQRYVLPFPVEKFYTYTGSSTSQCDVPPGYNGSIQKTTSLNCP